VTDLFLLGAEAFALELASWIQDSCRAEEYLLKACLALPGEDPRVRNLPVVALGEHVYRADAAYVLATNDPQRRRDISQDWLNPRAAQLPNFVHRSARAEHAELRGGGNVIGPFCYFGVNSSLGRLNLFNGHCSVGHHSKVGDDNFFAPGCHTGNSVQLGDHNFFGLGVLAAHGVHIGSGNRVQAGTPLLESIADGQLVMSPARIKQVALYGRDANG
jgi:acetyltransferase-like isoleucine patch superfamily enzyme